MTAHTRRPNLAQAFSLWSAHVATLIAAARALIMGTAVRRAERNAARARRRLAEALVRRMVPLLAVTLDITALAPLAGSPRMVQVRPSPAPGSATAVRRLALQTRGACRPTMAASIPPLIRAPFPVARWRRGSRYSTG